MKNENAFNRQITREGFLVTPMTKSKLFHVPITMDEKVH